MKGFINVIKPEGMSSAYAVGALKKKLNLPCGHMGTLDPMASGVLPVGVGKASRLFDYLLDKTKTYIATFRFGYDSDTLDITGKVEKVDDGLVDESAVKQALKLFIGEIDQVPPNYSAKCVDGKRGYQLARSGVEFSLPPKKVTIIEFELINRLSDSDFQFKIVCKGGTYIRSLARDLGKALNTSAIMTALDRTESGVFSYENGITVEELKSTPDIEKYLIPADSVISFEKVVLTNEQATRILNGLFDEYPLSDGFYRVYNGKEFWGVGKVENKILKIKSYVR